MKNLQDFILIVPNAVNADLRVKILQEYAGSSEWKDSVVGIASVVNKTIRNVSQIDISEQVVIEKNSEARTAIDKELFACAGSVLATYGTAFLDFTKIGIENDEGYSLLKYEASQFYVEHTDASTTRPRAISCSFAINDDYEGGDWSFFGGEYVTRLNAGDAILFPSNFLYPHSIRPVLAGVRYSIVTWFR